jgi:hypothetical protein
VVSKIYCKMSVSMHGCFILKRSDRCVEDVMRKGSKVSTLYTHECSMYLCVGYVRPAPGPMFYLHWPMFDVCTSQLAGSGCDGREGNAWWIREGACA